MGRVRRRIKTKHNHNFTYTCCLWVFFHLSSSLSLSLSALSVFSFILLMFSCWISVVAVAVVVMCERLIFAILLWSAVICSIVWFNLLAHPNNSAFSIQLPPSAIRLLNVTVAVRALFQLCKMFATFSDFADFQIKSETMCIVEVFEFHFRMPLSFVVRSTQ